MNNNQTPTMQVHECRACSKQGSGGEWIAPCQCDGTRKWVHRACLDESRARRVVDSTDERTEDEQPGAWQPDVDPFLQCPTCHFRYQFEDLPGSYEMEASRRLWRYRLHVARDVLLVVIALQIAAAGVGAIVYGLDLPASPVHAYDVPATVEGAVHAWLARRFTSLESTAAAYYVAGILFGLALVGLVGCIAWCTRDREANAQQPQAQA